MADNNVRAMVNDDNSAGRCGRCNRPIKLNAPYATLHCVPYGMECITYAEAAGKLMAPEQVETYVREQHRKKTSEDTKAGLARRKAKLAAESAAPDAFIGAGI